MRSGCGLWLRASCRWLKARQWLAVLPLAFQAGWTGFVYFLKMSFIHIYYPPLRTVYKISFYFISQTSLIRTVSFLKEGGGGGVDQFYRRKSEEEGTTPQKAVLLAASQPAAPCCRCVCGPPRIWPAGGQPLLASFHFKPFSWTFYEWLWHRECCWILHKGTCVA